MDGMAAREMATGPCPILLALRVVVQLKNHRVSSRLRRTPRLPKRPLGASGHGSHNQSDEECMTSPKEESLRLPLSAVTASAVRTLKRSRHLPDSGI